MECPQIYYNPNATYDVKEVSMTIESILKVKEYAEQLSSPYKEICNFKLKIDYLKYVKDQSWYMTAGLNDIMQIKDKDLLYALISSIDGRSPVHSDLIRIIGIYPNNVTVSIAKFNSVIKFVHDIVTDFIKNINSYFLESFRFVEKRDKDEFCYFDEVTDKIRIITKIDDNTFQEKYFYIKFDWYLRDGISDHILIYNGSQEHHNIDMSEKQKEYGLAEYQREFYPEAFI